MGLGNLPWAISQVVLQAFELLGQRHLEQLQVDVGLFLAAAGQQRCQALGQDAVGEGNVQCRELTCSGCQSRTAGLINQAEDPRGGFCQCLASSCQIRSDTGAALEQGHS